MMGNMQYIIDFFEQKGGGKRKLNLCVKRIKHLKNMRR